MKRLVLLLSMLLFASQTFSQAFTLGPKTGFTASRLLTNRSEIKEHYQANFQAGIFMRVGKSRYLQPELNFVTKGGVFGENNVLQTKSIYLSTIEIPVLFGARIIDCGLFNLRVLAGPSFSTIVDKEVDMRQGSQFIPEDRFGDVMLGFQTGVGIDLFMLTFDIRHEIGLNNISRLSNPPIEMRSSLFHFSLGWKLF